MEACIVIARLVGMLNSTPTDFYQLECFSTENRYVILKNEELQEVKVQISKNGLSYNIKEIK